MISVEVTDGKNTTVKNIEVTSLPAAPDFSGSTITLNPGKGEFGYNPMVTWILKNNG